MTINLTLFIQIIHFAIAYWLLRILFFKPAVAHITRTEWDGCKYKSLIASLENTAEQEKTRLTCEQQKIMSALEKQYPQKTIATMFSFDDIQIDAKQIQIPDDNVSKLQEKILNHLRSKVTL